VRITVDRERCIGSGNCAFYAPATFDLDDELKVMVLAGADDASQDALGDIRAAVEGCPVHALALDESGPTRGEA
jgi:ferredoxin